MVMLLFLFFDVLDLIKTKSHKILEGYSMVILYKLRDRILAIF